jgi:hypothetical protein
VRSRRSGSEAEEGTKGRRRGLLSLNNWFNYCSAIGGFFPSPDAVLSYTGGFEEQEYDAGDGTGYKYCANYADDASHARTEQVATLADCQALCDGCEFVTYYPVDSDGQWPLVCLVYPPGQCGELTSYADDGGRYKGAPSPGR